MVREVNVIELRNHLPKYLSTVQHGNEIWVTSHGQVIARILPPVNTKGKAIKALKLLRKHRKVGDVVSPIDENWDANI